ncbi:MAG: ATP-binding cassette domain-containing protein [Candidatus Izemoplasmatales bacterium]
MEEIKIKIVNLSKLYKISKNSNISALKSISFSLSNTGMTFVVGKSGAGKSTLLNIIGGVDKPTSGKIIYKDKDLTTISKRDLNRYVKHEIGFIFQEYFLIEDMTVSNNLELAISNRNMSKDSMALKISKALDDIRLNGYEDRKVNELSGGEKQRVAIARAIIKDAKVILCDEPTGNLDNYNTNIIYKTLKNLSKSKSVIVVTHHENIAKKYSDRLIILENGEITFDSNITKDGFSDINESSSFNSSFPTKKESRNFINNLNLNFIWLNFKRNIFSSIISIIIFCISISVLITFVAISNYSSYDTLIDTLKYNEQYVVKVTSYIDNSVFVGDQLIISGVFPTYELVEEEDNTIVESLTGNLLSTYNSYYFVKNFQDYLDYQVEADEYGSYPSDPYNTSYFTDVIIVEDFYSFYQPLKYGNYPLEDNDILIFDFMAMQLMNTNSFSNVDSMDDLIDYVLIDKDTGMDMKIVGILESNYDEYSYTQGESSTLYPFESLYLSELQSIFALPGFRNLILDENEYLSINSFSIYNATESYVSKDFYTRKIHIIDQMDSFDFIIQPSIGEEGLLLSNYQLSYILDMDVSDITVEFLQTNNLEARVKTAFLNQRSYLSSIGSRLFTIAGIYIADELNEDYVYGYLPNDITYFSESGNFRNLYIALDNDWEINRDCLREFEYPDVKEISFYYSNPDYKETGWMEYTPYTSLILETDNYMNGLKNSGKQLQIIIILLCILVVLNYTHKEIQRSTYRIGVMKSLGYRNSYIVVLYGTKILFIVLFSCILSIIPAIYLTSIINRQFVEIININLVFFSLTSRDFIITFVGTIIVTIISLVFYLSILINKTPIRIINKGTKI